MLAVRFVYEKEKAVVICALFVLQGRHPQGVVSTGCGAVFIQDAPLLAHERAGALIVVQHLQCNDGQVGFYRVAYAEAAQRAALGPLVRGRILAAIDRWGLQNDLFAMVRADREPLGVYLNFLKWYDREEAFMPLVSIDQHLRYALLVTGVGRLPAIAEVGRELTMRVLEVIGFEPPQKEPHAIAALRDQFIFSAVLYGAEGAASFAGEAVQRDDLHPDILKGVCQADAFLNGEAALARLIKRLESCGSEHERVPQQVETSHHVTAGSES